MGWESSRKHRRNKGEAGDAATTARDDDVAVWQWRGDKGTSASGSDEGMTRSEKVDDNGWVEEGATTAAIEEEGRNMTEAAAVEAQVCCGNEKQWRLGRQQMSGDEDNCAIADAWVEGNK
ncbi:hypothetical protein B296_00008205 [Ensete ventricosum]|uniref:DUF834 domain-containing protein n=1 Tax=Ensete ventricosum TaxID=4639 RepID=A0A427AVZ1_ENSVE|nr:hypothetical protein B296_00008205 [Ensete ventricosum]